MGFKVGFGILLCTLYPVRARGGLKNVFLGFDIPKPHPLYAIPCKGCREITGVWNWKSLTLRSFSHKQ